MIDLKGSLFERVIILWGVRWYVAYPIGYWQLEEMMREHGAIRGMGEKFTSHPITGTGSMMKHNPSASPKFCFFI